MDRRVGGEARATEQVPDSVYRLREAERAVQAQREGVLGRNMVVVLPRLKSALDLLAMEIDGARTEPWPASGAATAPALAALEARAKQLKAGANTFKLVAKSRAVGDLMRLDVPTSEVELLIGSGDRRDMARGRVMLLDAMVALGEANKAALYFTDWRGKLPEDQMARVDANISALEGVISAHFDLVTRLARGA